MKKSHLAILSAILACTACSKKEEPVAIDPVVRTVSVESSTLEIQPGGSAILPFRVEDKDAAIARVLAAAAKLARETGRSEMDGVRLEFDEGWISVRKSNTEPYLRLLVECRTRGMLDNWVGRLSDAIEGK